MSVTKNASAARELEPRSAAQFSNAHRDDVRRAALALEEIEKAIELRVGVGARGDFDDGRA